VTIRVFISFAHQSKPRAVRLAERLRENGYAVTMEDDFGARPPRAEISMAVEGCDIVVALVTPAYADGRATQRELDFAEAYGKHVVAAFVGLPSRSERAAPYAAYRRLELTEPWQDRDDQWEQVLELLLRVLETERSRREPTGHQVADIPDRAVLYYDVEDRRLAHTVLAGRPGWRRAGATGAPSADLPHVLLWTPASAERFSLVRRQYERLPRARRSLLVVAPDAPPAPAEYTAVPAAGLTDGDPAGPAAPVGSSARDQVEALIEQLAAANEGLPGDVFAERFCASGDVPALSQAAAELATRELPAGDPLRLRAVYAYVLALRFTGQWRVAVDVVNGELVASPQPLPSAAEVMRLRLDLERTSLAHELGSERPESVERAVRELQAQFRTHADLSGYVQAGRVLGNVLREQGDFDTAEQVFQRSIGIAEYLAEHSTLGPLRELTLADCQRELCLLHLARRRMTSARRCLEEAREQLRRVGDRSAGASVRYLSAVLDYVEATIAAREEARTSTVAPTELAVGALEALAGFENPIRLAAVYDWLGQAWTRQVPRRQDDLLRAEAYLRKALRIRHAHGHSFPTALSQLSLGELYEVLGDLDGGIAQYEEARRVLNQRGLRPALARAHAALARAYFRRAVGDGDVAGVRYRDNLARAEQLFRDIGLDREALELRFELEHGGRRPVEEVPDDTPLIAVGEYLLHRWIRERVRQANSRLDGNFDLMVGIGDDAAVVGAGRLDRGYGLVFTSDAAPGSLAGLDRSPEYVGRFTVVQTLADVLAMGARPVGILLNLFLSRSAPVGYARRVVEAVIQEAGRYGVVLLGGDVKEREEQSVGCVGIGYVNEDAILTRDAAQPGQALGITLASDPNGGSRLLGGRWAQELVEHYRMGNPRVLKDFPALARVVDARAKYDLLYLPDRVIASATRTGQLRAAMDTSDGLLGCLETLGRASGVGFELDERAIDLIIDHRARQLAEVLGIPPALFLFSAGHDWEIVFTCAENTFPALATTVGEELAGNGGVACIGRVVPRRPQDDHGVLMRRTDGSFSVVPYYTDEKFVPRQYQERPSQWLGFATRLRDAVST
jgi:thiamine-monophosphate kinase